MSRSTDLQLHSKRPSDCVKIRPSSLDEEDVRCSKSDSKKNDALTLGESYDFVLRSLSCSDIELDQPAKAFHRGDSKKDTFGEWSDLYAKMVHDMKVALAPALVPLVHTQVPSRNESVPSIVLMDEDVSSESRLLERATHVRQGDDECRFIESPRPRSESVASLCPSRSGPPLPKSLIMRDEYIPGLDGTRVVVLQNPKSKRSDPFIAEFYRSSVAPLLE